MLRSTHWLWFMSLVFVCAAVGGCAASGSFPSTSSVPEPDLRVSPLATPFSWLQPGLNAAHTADNTAEKTLSRRNVAKLKQAWSFTTLGQIGNPIVTDGSLAFADSADGYLYALNAATGKMKWRFHTHWGDGWATSPAVSGNLVYVPCLVRGNSQKEGLCALSEVSGKLQWSYYIDCNCAPPAGINAGPVVSGSTVVFGNTKGGGGDPNLVTALNAKTGALLWAVPAGDGGPNGLSFSTPAIAKGNVYVGTDLGLCSYRLASGAMNWCSGPADLGTAPAVSKGVVYTNTFSYGFYAYNSTSGSQLWQYSPQSGYGNGYADPPAIANGVVYFSGINSGYLYALNASTGKLLFDTSKDGSTAYTRSSPSVANGVVYAACQQGLCAYNSSTGKLRLATGSGGSQLGSPAVASGRVYTVCGSNDACMYDL